MAAKRTPTGWNVKPKPIPTTPIPTERWPSDHPYASIFATLCKYPLANEDFECKGYTKWLKGHLTNLKISIEECEKIAENWLYERVVNREPVRIVKASFRVTLYNYAHRRLHGTA